MPLLVFSPPDEHFLDALRGAAKSLLLAAVGLVLEGSR
jgi:hypothetical protein